MVIWRLVAFVFCLHAEEVNNCVTILNIIFTYMQWVELCIFVLVSFNAVVIFGFHTISLVLFDVDLILLLYNVVVISISDWYKVICIIISTIGNNLKEGTIYLFLLWFHGMIFLVLMEIAWKTKREKLGYKLVGEQNILWCDDTLSVLSLIDEVYHT